MKKYLIIIPLCILWGYGAAQPANVAKKQLNITILLDLSDRIDPSVSPANPSHFERDIEAVKCITAFFAEDMRTRRAILLNGKIKVIMSPPPQIPNINRYAQNLTIDLTSIKSADEKKRVRDSLSSIFTNNLKTIYKTTIRQQQWDGSDIWDFFNSDVKALCVDRDSNYRNILIILTDGYIYHNASIISQGNRYSYLLPKIMQPFRNNNWKQLMTNADFGLISTRNDLDNLEILVLEIEPSPQYKIIDERIIRFVLGKWFEEMKVKRYGILKSDIPTNTKLKIEDFLNSN
jgi:hypothetical protein